MDFELRLPEKLACDEIKNRKNNKQLWMQFIYYTQLWLQNVVVIVIAWVDMFQKITISEYILFDRLKLIAWNHNKVNFLWFSPLILRYRLEYPLPKLCFSERTPRVLSETTIKTWGGGRQKKIFVVKFLKKSWSPRS